MSDLNNELYAIEAIWWRNVQLGEFYNIERHHKIEGGGGSLYIEIPSSLVPDTLTLLDLSSADVNNVEPITIQAHAIGNPNVVGPIEFHKKMGGRMRIARQNRQQPGSQRHPAWTGENGFPSAPNSIKSKEDAAKYFPDGGLRIYLAKTTEGEFYAGFTKGIRPLGITKDSPMWELYPESTRKPVGGLIKAG
ncbi:MAG TPA: hypothetical protein DIS84_03575 [Corynebacterium stationis]|nr:hypothetical protein [Corynebacterium stationis]